MTAFVLGDGARLAYDVAGHGAPIVLFHGAESDMQSLGALGAALQPHLTVVRYDQRGCGQSDGAESPHDLLDLADDAVALMAHLGWDRFSVFGTSLGGRIAQAVALRHPARVHEVVLCNTWPLGHKLAELNPLTFSRMQVLRAGLPATARALAQMFYTPALVDAQPALVNRYAQWLPYSHRMALAAAAYPTGHAALPQPTLLLSGDQDVIVPTAIVRALAREIPTAGCRCCPVSGMRLPRRQHRRLRRPSLRS